jgi:hypothetical protein
MPSGALNREAVAKRDEDIDRLIDFERSRARERAA